MSMRNLLMTGLVCLTTTMSAVAAFTTPTKAQIAAVAADPAELTALLHGASLDQAAQIVKTVISRIAALELPTQEQDSRITLAISKALAALPAGKLVEFAGLLGTEMGGSLAIRLKPVIVSAVQGALAAATGDDGASMAKTFGDSFAAASSGSGNRQNTRDANKIRPPASKLYAGQN